MSYLDELFSLAGKTALVTGASRGLGLALATALSKAGAETILVSSQATRLEQARETLKAAGGVVSSQVCDLAEPAQIDTLVEYINQNYAKLDVLVNNAGVTHPQAEGSYPDASWEKTLRVNLEAPCRLIRGLAPMMQAQGSGSIINITSIAAHLGAPNNPAYAATKGGLKQLSRALASDLGSYGIRVNNIAPGYFHTDMALRSWHDPAVRQQRADRTLLGRWGEPEDLAGMVVLLAGDGASYITGQDFIVDGGWLTQFF